MAAITVAGFTLGCILHGMTGENYSGMVFSSMLLGFFSSILPLAWTDDDMLALVLGSVGLMGNLVMVGYLTFLATR